MNMWKVRELMDKAWVLIVEFFFLLKEEKIINWLILFYFKVFCFTDFKNSFVLEKLVIFSQFVSAGGALNFQPRKQIGQLFTLLN